jgi:hypothetical protein
MRFQRVRCQEFLHISSVLMKNLLLALLMDGDDDDDDDDVDNDGDE